MANFKLDKIYFFQYRSKLFELGQLSIYDKRPLMFPLDTNATHTLGINLHWIPPRFRKKFVEWLIDQSLKTKGLNRNRKRFARLVYTTVKNTAVLKPALKGIRLYINTRATNLTEIPRDEVSNFFLPRQMNKDFLNKRRAKKVKR